MKLWIIVCLFIVNTNGENSTNPVYEQLIEYGKVHCQKPRPIILTASGAPVNYISSSLSPGRGFGPLLLMDPLLSEVVTSFNRQQVIPRGNQGKGAGAFGYFEVTNDITKYCKAAVFEEIGRRTRAVVRLTIFTSEAGSSDATRAPRGMSVKLYTPHGILDLVSGTFVAMFARDCMEMINFILAFARNPVSNLKDGNMIWDFVLLHPEIMYLLLDTFGEAGISDGYRHMNTLDLNTYKMVNKYGEAVYFRYQFLTNQGLKNLTSEQAAVLRATRPDYYIEDLYNAIALGNFPSWTLYIQVMTFQEAEIYKYNPFDTARPWPVTEYPLKKVGKLVLNENPKNYLSDVEQTAFSPGNMVPGIEPSPDKLLQARMLVYPDAQRYRLGPNYLQLPVNRPFEKHCATNYQRNGQGYFCSQGGAPNYYPNSFNGPEPDPNAALSRYHVSGDVAKYNSSYEDTLDLATDFWNTQTERQKDEIVKNIVAEMRDVVNSLRKRVITLFFSIAPDLARKVRQALKKA